MTRSLVEKLPTHRIFFFLRIELTHRSAATEDTLLIKPASPREFTSLDPQWQQEASDESGASGKCRRVFTEDKEDTSLAFSSRAEERARGRCREAVLLRETMGPWDHSFSRAASLVTETDCSKNAGWGKKRDASEHIMLTLGRRGTHNKQAT